MNVKDMWLRGVYVLYSKATDMYYVGYTQKSFITRYIGHLDGMANRRHSSSEMCDVFYDYGIDNFEFKILEAIESECASDYKNREEYWTLKYLSSGNSLYNKKIADKFITGKSGYKQTKEFKKMLSEKYKGEGNPMYGVTGKKHPMYGKKHTEEAKETIRMKASKYTIEEYEKIYNDIIENTGELVNIKYKRLRKKWGCGEDLLKRLKSGRHWSRNYF